MKDYQRKHDLYQMQSDKLLAEQVPHEVKVAQLFAYEQLKMREKSAEMGKEFTYLDSVQVKLSRYLHLHQLFLMSEYII